MERLRHSKIIEEAINRCKVMLWAIEFVDGKPPRMLGDEGLYKMLEADEAASPEDIYIEWFNNVVSNSQSEVAEAFDRMKRGIMADVLYKYVDNNNQSFYMRISGNLNSEYQDRVRIEGCITDETELVKVKEKAAQQEIELNLVKDMELTYTGIAEALCRGYECVYYVNFESGRYKEYSSNQEYQNLKIQNEGDDFFGDTIHNAQTLIYADDRRRVCDFFEDREKLRETLIKKGTLSLTYRLMLNGEPTHYALRIVPLNDEDHVHYIVAVNNVEAEVRRSMEYEKKIKSANKLATSDVLTGVLNRRAYETEAEIINRKIALGIVGPFAIIVFDINNLKVVNDTLGHRAGDNYIKSATDLINRTFKHSLIYRLGGDEFAIILKGKDYFARKGNKKNFDLCIRKNLENHKVIIASGMVDFDFRIDKKVDDVFARADKLMYENKEYLKSLDKDEKPRNTQTA